MTYVSAILLAGGTGTRMGREVPKQYLPLTNKVVARHSFDLFLTMPEIREIIVVCHPSFQHYFSTESKTKVLFALPGARRQDSVYNGLQLADGLSDLTIVHDSARPLVSEDVTRRTLVAAALCGAATAAVPIKVTVKRSNCKGVVESTLDRSALWEIQTPQIIRTALLRRAFAHALECQIDVTDDVSLVEALGEPVQLVMGDYANLKVTTPEDLVVAHALLPTPE